MKYALGGRGNGKTARLIKFSAETGCCIVAQSEIQAHEIFKRAKEMRYDIPYPITVEDLTDRERMQGLNDPFYNGVIVDNAEHILQQILKVPVTALSMTVHEEDLLEPSEWFKLNPYMYGKDCSFPTDFYNELRDGKKKDEE